MCKRSETYNNKGFEDVNYLDNLGVAELEQYAREAFDTLGDILCAIGIQESESKAAPPSFIMVFLGILINALTMTLEITSDRREELKSILTEWMFKKSATLREMQSLLGKLSFVCSTVRAGRIFISRIIHTISTMPQKGRRRVSKELKQDLKWWSKFMDQFDGKSLIPTDWSQPDEVFATDSSLEMCGGWASPEYFKIKFPHGFKDMHKLNINELELMAFLIALKTWRNRIKNKNVLAYYDNQCTVDVINKGRARNQFAVKCLREITWILANENAF